MTTTPYDGIDAATKQENRLHPITADGKPLTAWSRRGATIKRAIAETIKLRADVEQLKSIDDKLDRLLARPF